MHPHGGGAADVGGGEAIEATLALAVLAVTRLDVHRADARDCKKNILSIVSLER